MSTPRFDTAARTRWRSDRPPNDGAASMATTATATSTIAISMALKPRMRSLIARPSTIPAERRGLRDRARSNLQHDRRATAVGLLRAAAHRRRRDRVAGGARVAHLDRIVAAARRERRRREAERRERRRVGDVRRAILFLRDLHQRQRF